LVFPAETLESWSLIFGLVVVTSTWRMHAFYVASINESLI
jgi:hypothetical protein